MALPLPDLDDRRWEDLVEEGRALIPFFAPEWTDHNAHDPGITLLELFAWLAEQDLFELNQITDHQRRKLLALAGVTPRPAQPAHALLELELTGNTSVALEAGLEFSGRDSAGESVRFRATHGLTALPGSLAAVQTGTAATFRNLTGAWKRGEAIQPFGDDPRRGSTFMIGIAPVAPWSTGNQVSLGFVIDGDDRGDALHHSVRLIWEIQNSAGTWVAATVTDGTRALSRTGRVALRLPDPPGSHAVGSVAWPLLWIRARIARGYHDAPPVVRAIALNAVEVEQVVPAVTWLRIATGADVPATPAPIGEWVHPDFDLDARGLVTRLAFTPAKPDGPPIRLLAWQPEAGRVAFEVAALGVATGAPSYTLAVPGDRLIEASVNLTSLEQDLPRTWEQHSDFDASNRADADFVVNAAAGEVITGDGERGRTAPAGSLVVATSDVTRGARGNLGSTAIDSVADSARNRALFEPLLTASPFRRVGNPWPATGGTVAETIREAIARAREEREAPLRAVTLADHVALAIATPGARIARAEARANFHPGFPCLVAPGIVTVLVLPSLPLGRPEPTDGLRQLVAAWLHEHRVIGSRIEVAGPVYVPVSVRATVGAQENVNAADLAAVISERIDQFLDPLLGGPDGTGWPFGRDVYRSEILQLIDETPGVEHVRALELIDGAGNASCGNFCLGPLGLPDGQAHQIEIVPRSQQ
jgi:hypothetical protein